ncbi:carbohydrate ABC transporter permease [Tuberibacillus sp. Marseille-P3662]|uniref:carbohydrate ABC transporter permease n=1 Tax=Tuberibacillus sp. Marseille-P3662 TaxID=1965358 RepID=UPI0020CB150A|nr:sugar ABC transporter permease [Tuberibacillus sp. Marseille-P3662]
MINPKTATRKKSPLSTDKWLALLFLLPSLILLAIFVYGFIGWTGYVSLSNWNSFVSDFSFAGFDNFSYIFHSFRFQADLRNMLFFTVFFIAAVVLLGQLLAVLIDQNIKGESFFRNIFLFPMALSFVVTGVVWRWVLNPQTGVNLLLEKFGVHLEWYTDTTVFPTIHIGQIEFGLPLALIAVIIAAVWQMTGFSLAMYLAGLRGVPDELREAARMDGASEFQIYRKVILPQLRPITFGVIVMMAHISLKIFDLIYTMTGPGANFVTDMPAVYMFETTFQGNFYAQGAAIAIILLILVAIFIVPYLISSRKGES